MGVTKLELMVLSEPQISGIRAREVLDCRGLPTVQVDVVVDGRFLGRADVPAGRSRGRHEPVELRDGGSRFGGFGVRRAIGSVRDVLAPALIGSPAVPQRLEHVSHAHLPPMPGRRMWGSGRGRAADRRTLCLLMPGAISRPTVDILTTLKIACQAGERYGRASSRWASPSWS